ncbi:MAG: M23 family metallopeptidase [Deltaproteobacteria bacterium]|nr:M23 family metallopeptidase [Deltaproteobacteria bacterium]
MNRLTLRLATLLIAALLAGCSPVHVKTPEERIQARKFLWPVSGTVSSGFGYRSSGRHEGIDILAPLGTPVGAAERGIVSYAGNRMRGYGNAVILDHGDGMTTLYGHLDTIRVKTGDVVPSSAPIGTVGRTGNATTDHLHFELRIDGEAMDPIGWLAGYLLE